MLEPTRVERVLLCGSKASSRGRLEHPELAAPDERVPDGPVEMHWDPRAIRPDEELETGASGNAPATCIGSTIRARSVSAVERGAPSAVELLAPSEPPVAKLLRPSHLRLQRLGHSRLERPVECEGPTHLSSRRATQVATERRRLPFE